MRPSQIQAWKEIDGWCSDTEADGLYQLATSLPKNSTVIEIGTWHGKSTTALALGCAKNGGHVYTIDHLHGSEGEPAHAAIPMTPQQHRDVFTSNVASLELEEYITLIEVDSISAVKFLPTDRKYRLLFIDGSHQTADVIRDFKFYSRLLQPKAMIAFHDYAAGGWPSVVAAVEQLIRETNLKAVSNFGSIGVFVKGGGDG